MAALSFAVHVDKENETPATLVHKGNVKTFGPRQGKLSQQTPRKALFDVNNELQLSSRVFRGKDVGISRPMKNPGKTRLDIIKDFENQHPNKKNFKKSEPKKELSQKPTKKIKTPIVQNKVEVPVKKQPVKQAQSEERWDQDEEWDSIFPRQERLSTYVDKLFSWRPPCLFGHIPDSGESDLSEEEDLDLDIIVDPLEVEGFPENANFLDLVVPLPEEPAEWESLHTESESQPSNDETAIPSDSDFALMPSPDTSLSLGSLAVMQDASPTPSSPSQKSQISHSS